MRDPCYVSLPDSWGVVSLDQDEELYYEVRGTTDTAGGGDKKKRRALLVMGAFASLRWLDCLADKLAAHGYEVVSYNHRGIAHGRRSSSSSSPRGDDDGKERSDSVSSSASTASTASMSSVGSSSSNSSSGSSGSSGSSSSSSSGSSGSSGSSSSSSSSGSSARLVDHHTVDLLAQDAWKLVEHVWGADAEVHLWGASMGGMVVQEMAVQELRAAEAEGRASRVASLFLAVTCRGIYPCDGMHPIARRVMPAFYKTGLIRLVLPLLVSRSKERMLQHLLGKCFRREYLDSVHPTSGETMRRVWEREWGQNFESWNTFHEPETCANQLMAISSHFLTDADADRIRKRVRNVTVQIATHDTIVPTFMQRQLADLVGARKIYVEGGHMLDTLEEDTFWRHTLEHFVDEY